MITMMNLVNNNLKSKIHSSLALPTWFMVIY